MPCAQPRPSSFSKGCTRTSASAAMKRPATPPVSAAASRPMRPAPRLAVNTSKDRLFAMKSIRYSRYTGEDLGLSAEDLLQALADFFLESGFDNPYMQFSEWNQHSLEGLKRALEEALERGEMFDPER